MIGRVIDRLRPVTFSISQRSSAKLSSLAIDVRFNHLEAAKHRLHSSCAPGFSGLKSPASDGHLLEAARLRLRTRFLARWPKFDSEPESASTGFKTAEVLGSRTVVGEDVDHSQLARQRLRNRFLARWPPGSEDVALATPPKSGSELPRVARQDPSDLMDAARQRLRDRFTLRFNAGDTPVVARGLAAKPVTATPIVEFFGHTDHTDHWADVVAAGESNDRVSQILNAPSSMRKKFFEDSVARKFRTHKPHL